MKTHTTLRVSAVTLPVLVVLLASCGGGTTPGAGSTSGTTTTGAAANTVAHPRKVTGASECHQLADANTVTQATTLTATQQADASNPSDCSFDLASKTGADAGQVTIALGANHAGVHGTATPLQIGGNPAQQQKLSGLSAGQQGCSLFVTLNDTGSLNTLTVTVLTFQSGNDTCTAARSVATNAFNKLSPA